MPNTRSAEKRLKTSQKKRLSNRIRKSRIKTFRRQLMDSIAERDLDAADGLLRKCFAELDRAAKVGTIHRNRANRTKHRLSARVRELRADAT